jgi:preprotein translocase subunit SecD
MKARSQRNLVLAVLAVLLVGIVASVPIKLSAGPLNIDSKPLWERLNLGLDLKGGVHVVLDAVDTPELPATADAVKQARDVIEKRVNGLGISEPVIQLQGEKRILVELAGVKNTDEALKAIGRTALLEFRDSAGQTIITGNDLQSAEVASQGTGWEVKLNLKSAAQDKFAAATTANVNKRIYIYLDGQFYSDPLVSAGGLRNPVISGYSTVDQAQAVAVSLNSGALPVKLSVSETRTISGALGKDSVHRSLIAGCVGVALVILVMLGFYRLSGVVADFCLAIYALLVLAAMAALGSTLTLPGIAGFILSVGMAVDANVITYERIREELRVGKTVKASIDAGYRNAMRTIIDSNVTTLIAAVVLFYFGTGSVRGFAVTLSLGILASMITAVVISRFLLVNMARAGIIRNDNTKAYFGVASSADQGVA